MLAHAQAVLYYDCVSEDDLGHRGALLYNVGWFNWRQGRYASPYREVSEAYSIKRKRSGKFASTTLSRVDSFFRRQRNKGRSLVPVRYLFDWSCCAHAEALGRIHFAGALIVSMAMTDSPYTQAQAGCNAAATNVGRPTARNRERRGMGRNCGRSGQPSWSCYRGR